MTQERVAADCELHYCQKDGRGNWVCIYCGMTRDRFGKEVARLTLVKGEG